MKEKRAAGKDESDTLQSELLILPDGIVLAHNITPLMAAVLSVLNPEDAAIRERLGTQRAPAAKP